MGFFFSTSFPDSSYPPSICLFLWNPQSRIQSSIYQKWLLSFICSIKWNINEIHMVIKIRLFNAAHSSLPIPFSAYSWTTLNLRSPGRNISYFRLSDWNQKSKSYLTPPSYTLYVEIIQREIDKSQSRKTVYLFTSQTFINCHALVQILQSSDLQQ